MLWFQCTSVVKSVASHEAVIDDLGLGIFSSVLSQSAATIRSVCHYIKFPNMLALVLCASECCTGQGHRLWFQRTTITRAEKSMSV